MGGEQNEQKLHGVFCGATFPAPVTSEGNILRIEFNSDNSVQKTGFVAEFRTGRFVPDQQLGLTSKEKKETKQNKTKTEQKKNNQASKQAKPPTNQPTNQPSNRPMPLQLADIFFFIALLELRDMDHYFHY